MLRSFALFTVAAADYCCCSICMCVRVHVCWCIYVFGNICADPICHFGKLTGMGCVCSFHVSLYVCVCILVCVRGCVATTQSCIGFVAFHRPQMQLHLLAIHLLEYISGYCLGRLANCFWLLVDDKRQLNLSLYSLKSIMFFANVCNKQKET